MKSDPQGVQLRHHLLSTGHIESSTHSAKIHLGIHLNQRAVARAHDVLGLQHFFRGDFPELTAPVFNFYE
jgi:hypothetical protein